MGKAGNDIATHVCTTQGLQHWIAQDPQVISWCDSQVPPGRRAGAGPQRGPPGSFTYRYTIIFGVRIHGLMWLTYLCDKHFQLRMLCLFDTFSREWNCCQSQLHVFGCVGRWAISKLLVGGGHWTLYVWFVCISFCFHFFERLHRWNWIVSGVLLNLFRLWFLLFCLTMRLWCTWYFV